MSCFRSLFGSKKKALSNYGAEPSTRCRPSPNFMCDDRVVMHSATTLALVCLGDEHFRANGRWSLTEAERRLLLERIESFTCTTGQDCGELDGCLSEQEFEDFVNNEENRQWVVEHLPSSAHGLACPDLMENAFEAFDINGDKKLDKKEWHDFMDFMTQLRLRYLQQMGLVEWRAYFGLGQDVLSIEENLDSTDAIVQSHVRQLVERWRNETREELANGSKMRNMFQWGILVKDWKAWREDMWYYSANVHPLHAIWASCANNRLERSDRLCMEIAIMFFSYWMAHERHGWTIDNNFLSIDVQGDPWWMADMRYFSFIFITAPGMIMNVCLVLLFTTPHCGTVDESTAGKRAIKSAERISMLGDYTGNFLVLSLIALTFIRILLYDAGGSLFDVDIILFGLRGRIGGYACAWGLMLFVNFNPFIAWGSARPGTYSILDLVGLGQWSLELGKMKLACLDLPEEEPDLTHRITEYDFEKSSTASPNLHDGGTLDPCEIVLDAEYAEKVEKAKESSNTASTEAPTPYSDELHEAKEMQIGDCMAYQMPDGRVIMNL